MHEEYTHTGTKKQEDQHFVHILIVEFHVPVHNIRSS